MKQNIQTITTSLIYDAFTFSLYAISLLKLLGRPYHLYKLQNVKKHLWSNAPP